jgi:hypothetical protein
VRPYLKKTSQKKAGEEAQGGGPEFEPHYCKKKKDQALNKCSDVSTTSRQDTDRIIALIDQHG